MTRKAGVAVVVTMFLIVAGLRYPTAAQSPAAQPAAPRASPAADPALNAILLELRALRGDLAAANSRQLAAQLLVGRLQMQEQRIAYLDGQRALGAAKLTDAVTATAGVANRLSAMSEGCGREGGDLRTACEQETTALKRELVPLQATEQQLRLAQVDLENAVATEQRRWSEFNDRLDVLERSLPAR